MNFEESFKSNFFSIQKDNFDEFALELYRFQFHENPIYQSYSRQIRKTPAHVKNVEDIPFLPIEFFKSHAIQSGKWDPKMIFLSSGTTQSGRSRHLIKDPEWYLEVASRVFENAYGPLKNIKWINLLQSYREQSQSSLIFMVDHFIKMGSSSSEYVQENFDESLLEGPNTILFGVSFALLNTIEKRKFDAPGLMVMETGGMKGRRKEITRHELHTQLMRGFNVNRIHSEYGMTELLSQAYAADEGQFQLPVWSRVMIRDLYDPFSHLSIKSQGGINIIDLANIHSCAFIETKDIGKVSGEHFEVLGRYDNSDIRGCNLLANF